MKPQTITKRHPNMPAVLDWLRANGVRHHIPADARIVVTGNMIITPTFDIGRTYNPRYMARALKSGAVPVKIRRYRIRHELQLGRGA